ncbi:MAG: 16S rRNA (guanine(527)-N(7))-methyltransferase RsmG [Acidobacteria bacterium]|nr:MAG: 16S rRNA (guanine(527)-N(7))-methyltransferase RsmG [Acidobacteriota bacterium]PYY08430.1 MAG: 16S rRNA (guanine(527)-N(7))-methyltransferase RsmG [Acidobacteriota bacterium]
MDSARIAELLASFLERPLSESQLEYISMYIDILLRWNQKLNLTAVRDPEQVAMRHFGESLFAAQHLFPRVGAGLGPDQAERRSPLRVADVGSGAGFPGLPIKLFVPEVHLTLIESNHKKATFLREVVRLLALADADVFSGRAEELPHGSAEVVTLRAVEQFDSALPVAMHLVAPGGRLALFIGASQASGVPQVAAGFNWSERLVMPLSSQRILLVGRRDR